MPLAERLLGRDAQISFIGVSVESDTDINQFRFGWSPRLSRFRTPVQFQEATDIEETLDQSAAAENLKLQAYAVTGMSLMVALFIIFCTLNMGVSERVRQFAVLRAVVLTRAQVGLLITIESLALATIGFLGGLGTGTCLLWLAATFAPNPLQRGSVIGIYSILLAAVCAYGSALLASLVPAYRATRVRPVDAMAPRAAMGRQRVPLPIVVLGLVLIPINPLLTFVAPLGEDAHFTVCLLAGCTTMIIGFILIAPGAVAVVDRLISPLLARVLGLPPKLLASQISSNLWRTVGTAVALTIGLGIYIAIQVWGDTMLDSFLPGRWAPDAIISFHPAGLAPEKAFAVAQFPGVDANRCLPIVVEQPRLLEDLTGSAERPSVIRQDSVVIVGLDPARAFGGDHPLLKFDWVAGSAEQALDQLKKGHACIVPDHFLRETKLKVGDSFALVPPENHEHPVRYTIAGAVCLPGWHWQTKPTGFRSRTHRAAALVFADYSSVAGDFDLPAASHVWFSYNSTPTDKDQLAVAAQSLYRKSSGTK